MTTSGLLAQNTITVNDFSDTGGVSNCPGSPCTLRDALSIATSGDVITFAGPGVILVNSAGGLGELPAITAGQVTLATNGYEVVLDGSQSPVAEALSYGLQIVSDENVITGLTIRNFSGHGLYILNGNGNQIGGTSPGAGNLIHLNGGDGVHLQNAGTDIRPNQIIGNAIGVNSTGNAIAPNGGAGIRLTGGQSNFIGGVQPEAANVISGNAAGGVVINTATGTLVEGNFIGVDRATGMLALGNGTTSGDAGVSLLAGHDTVIQFNTIADNTGDGILSILSNNITVASNYVGTGAAGVVLLGNDNAGIRISNADNITVDDNVVLDSFVAGIFLDYLSGSIITGNKVGLSADGITAGGNGSDGIRLGNGNDIDLVGNLIGYNSGDGVDLFNVTDIELTGNIIGEDGSGNAAPNSGNGILVGGVSSDLDVVTNVIANNLASGIAIAGGDGVTINGNNIANNALLGIDLNNDSVTPNDPLDGDSGPNGLQNFPVLSSAVMNGAVADVSGQLNSAPNTNYSLEIFGNSACDSSFYGEGEIVTGAVTAFTTDGSGTASFSLSVNGVNSGDYLTALVTDVLTGNTSEFSACMIVDAAIEADFTANPTSGLAPLVVNFTDASNGNITSYAWDFGDGSTSSAQNPVHTYSIPGNYTVTLTVSGVTGSDSATQIITVTQTLTATNTPVNTPVLTTSAPSIQLPTVAASAVASTPTAASLVATSTQVSATSTSLPTRMPSATSTLRPTVTASHTVRPSLTPTLPPTQTAIPPTATLMATATFTPTPLPVLTVVKVTDESGFDVIIENAGPGDAVNLQLSEALRPGVRYISALPGNPVCVEDGGIVYCTLGVLRAGAQALVDLVVSTDGTDPASGRTVVTSDGQVLEIIDQPYLLKIGTPPIAGTGAQITYTLRAINPTDHVASQVRIEDFMPAEISIVDAVATEGQVMVQGQEIHYMTDQLESGERVTITVKGLVQGDGSANQIVNEACLYSSLNRTPSCAAMRFVRADAIPNTGESHQWQPLVFQISIAIGLLVAGLIGYGILVSRGQKL